MLQMILLEVSLTGSEGMLSDCNNRVLSIQALEQVWGGWVGFPHVSLVPAPHNKWIRADYVSYYAAKIRHSYSGICIFIKILIMSVYSKKCCTAQAIF